MKYLIFDKKGRITTGGLKVEGEWALVYTNCEADYRKITRNATIPIFGATSFQGVFTPEGFVEGGAILVGEREDGIQAVPYLIATREGSASAQTKDALIKMKNSLNGNPDCLLMHATSGYEERILDGIKEVFGDSVPVFGGSAGDNDLTGKWRLMFHEDELNEGVLLVGFKSNRKIYGAFLGGYLPTGKKGKITRVEGRTVHEIDGRPAAVVYNEWTGGVISSYLDKGGVVLAETTLYPIGRAVGELLGMPIYLLSHPHQVSANTKSLTFFTEFKKGEEIVLMMGTKSGLIERTRQVASKALGADEGKVGLRGGILIYCAGCVLQVMDQKEEIIKAYKTVVGAIPFIGAATFGEQGCFFTKTDRNRHGNLMCDTILFS
jgi:hypothetical protein